MGGDSIGQVLFTSDGSVPAQVEYGSIQCIVADPDTTFNLETVQLEPNNDGKLQFNVAEDGSLTEAMSLDRSQIDFKNIRGSYADEVRQHRFV